MNIRKRHAAALLFAILSLAAAAAAIGLTGSPSGSGLAVKPGDSGQVTISMTYWAGSQLTIDKNNQIIELFEKAYPRIKVKAEYFWGDAYSSKLAVMAAANRLPDVIRIDYSRIAAFMEKDLLLPLDGYVDKNVIRLEGADPVHNAAARRDGKLYAVNIGNNALTMFYNPQLLRQAGVEPPSGYRYTWEDYEEELRRVRDGTPVYGDTHLTFRHFQVWLREQGSRLYSDSQTGLGYEDDGLFTGFFARQLQLQAEALTTPLSMEQETSSLDTGPFPRGLAAFGGYEYWSNQIDIVEQKLGHAVGLAMYPGSTGKGMFIKPSFFHAVSRSSKHPDEAALFIDFYTFNLEAAKALNGYFGMPYHPRVIDSIRDTLTPTQRNVLAYLKAVEQEGSPIDPPEPAAGPQVASLFRTVGNEVLFGRISPGEGASQFRREANALLNTEAVNAP